MNETIISVFYDQMLQKTSYEDAKYKIRLEILIEYFKREFEGLLQDKNHKLIEPLVFLPQWFGLERMYLSYYDRLLVEHWHFEHESLISTINSHKEESSIPYIEQAIKTKFEYMECDVNNFEGTLSIVRESFWV